METLKVIKCELRIRQKRNRTTWEVLTVTMYSDGSVTRTVLCERGTEEEAMNVISRSGNDGRYSATPGPDQASTETLTQEQMTRYLQLTDRRMFIVMHSGASWKPEYAQELEEIDRELATLRPVIDAAIADRRLAWGQAGKVGFSNT